jgi:hypothetical protein
METVRVLGVDLACRSWDDNGSAVLEFDADGWRACRVRVARWPSGPVTAGAMADVLDEYAREAGIAAVCLDGPQGWREPGIGPADRLGCGRWAEYEVSAQGKAGEYGRTYPRRQARWIRFCIDVFDRLLARDRVRLANDPDATRLPLPDGGYYLLEVFPTSIWRASGLAPLPGKRRTTLGRLRDGQVWLAARYGMPAGFIPDGSHDDLQAVVSTLPGIALFGGPALPEPNGLPARWMEASGAIPAHRVEGIIWDARPASPGDAPAAASVSLPAPLPLSAGSNPLLPDDRDTLGEEVIDRGVALFRQLVQASRAGEATGIGYACFAAMTYGAADYSEVMGRHYAPCDNSWVIELADQVTAAAGGPECVARNGATIQVGMDSFIWPSTRPHTLSVRAFAEHRRKYGYSQHEWEVVFPESTRRVLTLDEAKSAAGA